MALHRRKVEADELLVSTKCFLFAFKGAMGGAEQPGKLRIMPSGHAETGSADGSSDGLADDTAQEIGGWIGHPIRIAVAVGRPVVHFVGIDEADRAGFAAHPHPFM